MIEKTNIWGNGVVYLLATPGNKVIFQTHLGSVYECQREAWDIHPLPRNLKAPEA